MAAVGRYRELRVYQAAFDAAMQIFEFTNRMPSAERFDQIRRSSRSVRAILADARRRRRYRAHFVSKLSDAECEAEGTRV